MATFLLDRVEYIVHDSLVETEYGGIQMMLKLRDVVDYVPFHAHPNDCEPHGKILYDNAIKGKYGTIKSFQPDQSENKQKAAALIRKERDELLKGSDWTQLPDIPNSLKEVYAKYRQELRDLPQQDGFPYDVKWPKLP